jgi:hypothetical protein
LSFANWRALRAALRAQGRRSEQPFHRSRESFFVSRADQFSTLLVHKLSVAADAIRYHRQ